MIISDSYIKYGRRFVVGLVIIVDDSTNLTSWFLSSDKEPRSFTGVQLSKQNNDSLVVAYATGIGNTLVICCNIVRANECWILRVVF